MILFGWRNNNLLFCEPIFNYLTKLYQFYTIYTLFFIPTWISYLLKINWEKRKSSPFTVGFISLWLLLNIQFRFEGRDPSQTVTPNSPIVYILVILESERRSKSKLQPPAPHQIRYGMADLNTCSADSSFFLTNRPRIIYSP